MEQPEQPEQTNNTSTTTIEEITKEPVDNKQKEGGKQERKEPVYHPRAVAKWEELERRGLIQKTSR